MYVYVCECRFGVALFNSFLVISALQLLLIILKLTSALSSVNWAAVLVPLWMFFGFFCVLPCCQELGNFRMDPVVYLGCMVMFWVPFVVFFVSLAVKLQTRDSHRIRIALIFIPMWIIEGMVMLLNLFYLVVGIIRSVTDVAAHAVFAYLVMYVCMYVQYACMYECMYVTVSSVCMYA